MVDWLKLRLPVKSEGYIPGDVICIFDPQGGLKWQKTRAAPMRGSFESDVHVSTCGYTGLLVIDGNPAKFFQGHNVFGSADMPGLARSLAYTVLDNLDLPGTDEQMPAIQRAEFELGKIDLNRSLHVGTLLNARSAVRSLSDTATMKYRGRGSLCEDGTAYWAKHSRRSSLKCYAKGHELTAHPLPKDLPFRSELLQHAQALLRIELVIRTMELKERGLNMVCNWEHNTGTLLFDEFLGNLEVSNSIELAPEFLSELPPRLRLAYDSWMRGTDLRVTLPRMTFYRYRQALLPYGVDLLTLNPAQRSNVVPMVKILEAVPVGIPDWAVGTPLLFDPSNRAA
jgi:II/X family phage/plasmid replication protein